MKQKDTAILVPIIFSAITSYVIYDILSALLQTIYIICKSSMYMLNSSIIFVECLIFPFFSACSSILIVNKITIKKQISILPFLVSIGSGIIIFAVSKVMFILVININNADYMVARDIIHRFSRGFESAPRQILLAILVGIGELIVLKSSRITPENITTSQLIIQPAANQANFTNMITGGQTMFCRNCGNRMDDNAVICVKCGAAKGSGNSYCPNCGKETNPNAAVCLNCGCALTNTNIVAGENAKSKLVAGLLAIFLGGLGIHNFYLGYTQKGVIQLLITLLGSCLFFIGPIVTAIWALIEAIFIFTGKINVDGKGNPLKD